MTDQTDTTKIDAQLEAMLKDAPPADAPPANAPKSDETIKIVAPVVPKLKQRAKGAGAPVVETGVQTSPEVAAPEAQESESQRNVMQITDAPLVVATPKLAYVSQRTLDEMEAGRKSIERF